MVTNHECSGDMTQAQPSDSVPALVGSTRSELRISLTLPLPSARCIHLGVYSHISCVTFPTYFPSDQFSLVISFSKDPADWKKKRINPKPTFRNVTSVELFTYSKPNLYKLGCCNPNRGGRKMGRRARRILLLYKR